MFTGGPPVIDDRPRRAHRCVGRFATTIPSQQFVADRVTDGHITESGTYAQLVNNPDSRFRALMAAQLNATSGKTLRQTPEAEATGEQTQSP